MQYRYKTKRGENPQEIKMERGEGIISQSSHWKEKKKSRYKETRPADGEESSEA